MPLSALERFVKALSTFKFIYKVFKKQHKSLHQLLVVLSLTASPFIKRFEGIAFRAEPRDVLRSVLSRITFSFKYFPTGNTLEESAQYTFFFYWNLFLED